MEFRAAYETALQGHENHGLASDRHQHGSFNWLIETYKKTPTWQKLAPITQRNLMHELDRFGLEHGDKSIIGLRPEHVEALIAKKASTPAAANRLLKLIKRLSRFAMKRGIIATDPTIGVGRYRENPDGFHTWTDAEIAVFESFHGPSSKAVLALRLMLYTGAARRDVIAMGWRSVSEGRISYRRGKTRGDVDLPIVPELREVLSLIPKTQMLFLTHTGDRPYKPETFGNWFHDQCKAAGLPHCTPHGLRKAGATRLANAGATEFEIMAFLGHKTPADARTYTKKASRRTLGDSGMKKLARAKRERKMSNLAF